MIIAHKVTLAAVLALGITTPPARVGGDPATAQISNFAAPALGAPDTPPEAPMPDPAITGELARSASRLAVDIAHDQRTAAVDFQLGRLEAFLTHTEHNR